MSQTGLHLCQVGYTTDGIALLRDISLDQEPSMLLVRRKQSFAPKRFEQCMSIEVFLWRHPGTGALSVIPEWPATHAVTVREEGEGNGTHHYRAKP